MTSWIKKLKTGLSKSSNKINENIKSVFTKKLLDNDVLEELEEVLIMADLGAVTSAKIVKEFSKNRFGKEVSNEEIREALAKEIENILDPCAKEMNVNNKPFVILMVGVNGSGKTTTIGKLAKNYSDHGKKVMLGAGDTFRAAAIGQLKIWADRANCEIVLSDQGSDPAALAYKSIEKAKENNTDILMIDTAGRLQNKKDLMEELSKITRVIKKQIPDAPHETLLVLDSTTGQNAYSQIEVFKDLTNITGLILTKLDGSAKGGVIVGLADKFKLPIYAIGVGEGIDDLQAFKAKDFSKSLMGVNINESK